MIGVGERLAPTAAYPPSLAQRSLRRQAPEVEPYA